MKQAVINPMKCQPHSIIASNRIARFLAFTLGCPLIDSADSCSGEYDRVFIVNGPMLYCNFRTEMQALVNRAKEVFWVENDYTIQPPGFIKSREPFILSACENYRGAPGYQYVNWNQLTFNAAMKARPVEFGGLLYYGAFRKGREKYFRKYLASDLYPVTISSSRQGSQKFFSFAPKAKYLMPSDLSYIGAYTACLYIEDEKSHKVFTSPANRFYEALSAHALQLFDRSCAGTFEKAGVDITPWIIDGPEDVPKALLKADRLRSDQMARLRGIDYAGRLREEFKRALDAV